MTRVFRHDPIDFNSLPPGIKALMAACIAGFALSWVVPDAPRLFGLVPSRVVEDRWVWQVVTYLFLHGGFLHLLFNLFALWMFGMPVESQWGRSEFLKFYFLCGLGAALTSIALDPHSTAPVIGASGSVYGLLVAFAMLYPDAVVYLYFLIPIKAAHMAILFGLVEFFTGMSGSTPGVARFAHLGGMVTGYLYIRWGMVVKLRLKSLFRASLPEIPAPPAGRKPRRVGTPVAAPEDAMAQVDRVLDKILAKGLDSLTEEEREIMRRYKGGNA